MKCSQKFVYTIHGRKLKREESIKVCGAIINYIMSLHVHITNAVNDAYEKLDSLMTTLETSKGHICFQSSI